VTIPEERYNSIIRTREFLESLLDPKKTPRIPKKIRTEAYWCLRHYPFDMHMEQVAEKLPEVFRRWK
jgi:hypothetical protein